MRHVILILAGLPELIVLGLGIAALMFASTFLK